MKTTIPKGVKPESKSNKAPTAKSAAPAKAKPTPKPAPAKKSALAPAGFYVTAADNSKGTYSWMDLQEILRELETSAEVEVLLKDELRGPARARWLNRIHGRRCILRNAEEFDALMLKAKA